MSDGREENIILLECKLMENKLLCLQELICRDSN